MRNLRGRLLGILIILIFGGIIYYSWHQLNSEGIYSLKMAAFGPVGVVGGLFLLFFPGRAGRPETTSDKSACAARVWNRPGGRVM